MIIINLPTPNANAYIISIGADAFRVCANNEAEAIENITKYFITQDKRDWYFSALEVELMAKSAQKTVEDFAKNADFCYCPKYKIYLPKLTIQKQTNIKEDYTND